jgi:hypothetical protein
MKIVINRKHGGFGLSDEAVQRYIDLNGVKLYKHVDEQLEYRPSYYYVPYEEYRKTRFNDSTKTEWEGEEDGVGRYKDSNNLCWSYYDIKRNDPALVQTVEELGSKANGWAAELKVVDIPDDVEWLIEEYDGLEWVAEKHRTWE